MMRFKNNLGARVFLSVMAAMAVVVALMDFMFLHLQRESIKETIYDRGAVISHTLAENVRVPTFAGDKVALERAARSMLGRTEVVAVSIYDVSGRLIVGSSTQGLEAKATLEKLPEKLELENWSEEDEATINFFHIITSLGSSTANEELFELEADDVTRVGGPLGILALSISKQELKQAQEALFYRHTIVLLFFIPIVAFITYIVVKTATMPLRTLVKEVAARSDHADGDSQYGDVGMLSGAFDRLLKELSRSFEEINELNEGLELKVEERTEVLAETNSMLRQEVERRRRAESNLSNLLDERTQKLKETHAQLLHADKLASLGRLSAGLSHEINNPICGLSLTLDEVMHRDDVSDEVITLLAPCKEQCNRISKLIADLGRLKRPTSDDREPVELHGFLDGIYYWMRKTLEKSGVQLDRDYSVDDLVVRISSDQLSQVFLNLFNNAIDAMSESSPKIIGVSTSGTDDSVIIRVEDTGPGISRAEAEKLFEPFYSTKPLGTGTGLGLSVSREIVTDHGGTLKVFSDSGCGGVFELTLPRLEGKRVG